MAGGVMVAPFLIDAGSPVDGIDPACALQIMPPHMDRANRPAWLAARRRGIGSSDASTLVRLNRWESPFELWEDKTGQTPLVDDQSEAAEMGVLLEPVVRDRFARVHNLTVRPVGLLQSQRWPWMLASLDGLCSDGYGYEGKTCSPWAAGDWSDGQTADHAELQAQWCMAVTGLGGWHVACLIGGQRNVYRFVNRDQAFIDWLADYSGAWWERHVVGGERPPLGGTAAATSYMNARYPLAVAESTVDLDEDERDQLVAERARLDAAQKTAVAEFDAYKNEIRRQLGDREYLVCGEQVLASWTQNGQFSTARFRDHHPDLAAAYSVEVTATEIDTARLATDHPDIYRQYRARRLLLKD